MAEAQVHQSIREFFATDDDTLEERQDYALGTSVLLTPDTTPTKDTKSVTNKKHKLPQPCLKDDQVVPNLDHQYAKPRPASLMDSPKPTQSKQTKSEPKETSVRGKGRKGKSKKAPANAKSKATDKPATTSSKPSQSCTTRARTVTAPAQKNNPDPKTTLVTDYFPIRRSSRVPSKDLKKQHQSELEEKILSGCEDGLLVKDFVGKGRGVVATAAFKRGDFVVEYIGDTIELEKAKKREKAYKDNPDFGCYMYYFTYRNKPYCVDATAESDKLGRLLNHSKNNGNCQTRVVGVNNKPHLILVAMRDIEEGEELLYDYGDRSKSSLEAHPWLAL